MTTLDDALNSSSPVFHRADMLVDWKEAPPTEASNPSIDTVRDLSEQLSGGFIVEQSLDDGLPDAVTMTQTNDASGTLKAALAGREAVVADLVGWRSATSGTGAGGAGPTSLPSDATWGDYLLCCISIASNVTQALLPTSDNPRLDWQLLSTVEDGSAIKTWIFGVQWYQGLVAPLFNLDLPGGLPSAATYSWVIVAAYARTHGGNIYVPYSPGTPVGGPESASTTTHSATPATLNRRGFMVAFWGQLSATPAWTATGGATELAEAAAAVDLMVSTSTFREASTFGMTATTGSATAVATMQLIPLEVADRRRMDATALFSPFNADSPFYGFDRDTAETTLKVNVVTAAGIEGTVIHQGQMAEIPVNGRDVSLSAVSKTRIDIDGAYVLPKVRGYREGLSVDWLVAWIAARGGQFVGPAPTPETVIWDPMYGSLHPFIEMPQAPDGLTYGNYMFGTQWDDNDADYPYTPYSVEGPFHLGMFACQTTDRLQKIKGAFAVPPSPVQFGDVTLEMNDQLSQGNSKGRLSLWMRGDAHVDNPPYLPGPDDPNQDKLLNYQLYAIDSAANRYGSVQVMIDSGNRFIQVAMGADPQGYSTVQFNSVGALPTDGEWHFITVSWDWAAGSVTVKMDGLQSTNTSWTSLLLTPSQLPVTTALGWAGGWITNNFLQANLPISEFRVEAGTYYTTFTDIYPTQAAPSFNATVRPTYQPLTALYGSTPVQGWATIAELAQSSMSAYRMNEMDNFEFLPQSYFGETEQMTVETVFDTEVNTSDLNVVNDPTMTRNVVTVEFSDTQVTTNVVPVLTVGQNLVIPPGTSYFTFTLDVPCVEIWSEGNPGADSSGNWTFYNLNATEVANNTPPTFGHYMTINSKAAGNSLYRTTAQVRARIMSATSSTVTIRFQNFTGNNQFLTNNGDNVPFLLVRGCAVSTSDGYSTQSDTTSVNARRQRPMSTEVAWVQDRDTAASLAARMVNTFSQPRPQVAITVTGDPRRKPGKLVELADSQGTQAAGTWRILFIRHNSDGGGKYTQDLNLVRVLPIAVWDGPDGWDFAVWGE